MDRVVALDFGTTNSALAVLEAGAPRLALFERSGECAEPTFPSVLYFEADHVDARRQPVPWSGPRGIEGYLEGDGMGRFIQSLKSYLVSRSFRSTSVFGRRYALEELIAEIVSGLRAEAEASLGPLGSRVVCGRPVHFTRGGEVEEDAFAVERLARGLALAGFEEVTFVYEPVAAAYHYERGLSSDELVLIGDFGGGTSDFTLMRVGPSAVASGRREREVLGTAGVPIAGNAFDYAMVRQMVAPHLGQGTDYRTPFGRLMEVPRALYMDLEWHRLSLLHAGDLERTLEELERQALEPERIARFRHIVRYGLGYHLYRSVEAVKVALSRAEEARFCFEDEEIAIAFKVTREDFEGCIGELVAELSGCVDGLLASAGVERGAVDRVFLTGGSSLVPSVRRIFEERFGAEKLSGGGELTSVVSGLAWSGLVAG